MYDCWVSLLKEPSRLCSSSMTSFSIFDVLLSSFLATAGTLAIFFFGRGRWIIEPSISLSSTSSSSISSYSDSEMSSPALFSTLHSSCCSPVGFISLIRDILPAPPYNVLETDKLPAKTRYAKANLVSLPSYNLRG